MLVDEDIWKVVSDHYGCDVDILRKGIMIN
jgi:hypothetical protein